VLRAERPQPFLVAAEDEHALERRQRDAERSDVRCGLATAADHAERRRTRAREVLRGDGRGGGGASLAQRVGLDDRLDPRLRDREENDEERRASPAATRTSSARQSRARGRRMA